MRSLAPRRSASAGLAVGESSAILPHPPLPSAGAPAAMERERVSGMTVLWPNAQAGSRSTSAACWSSSPYSWPWPSGEDIHHNPCCKHGLKPQHDGPDPLGLRWWLCKQRRGMFFQLPWWLGGTSYGHSQKSKSPMLTPKSAWCRPQPPPGPEDCNLASTLSPSLLRYLAQGEGGAAE